METPIYNNFSEAQGYCETNPEKVVRIVSSDGDLVIMKGKINSENGYNYYYAKVRTKKDLVVMTEDQELEAAKKDLIYHYKQLHQ